MKRTLALLLALLTVIGMLAGCAKEPEKTPDPVTPAPGGDNTKPGTTPDPVKPAEPYVYYYVRSSEETVLNPHDSNLTANLNVNDRVIGVLYNCVPGDDGLSGKYIPTFAAAEPEVDATGYVWTIKLNKDAVWADGTPINADDWLYSWQMTWSPKLMYGTGESAAKGTTEIKNAFEYYKSESEKNGVKWEDVGVKKVDDYTIEVTMAQKYMKGEVMRHFASRTLALVKKDIYEKCISADGTTCDYGSSMDKVAFCGPFVITQWTKGTEIIFEKNDKWPNADLIHIDKIISRVVTDESTRLELFEKGEASHIDLGTNGLAKYGEDPRVRNYDTQTINTLEVNHNHADPEMAKLLNDPEFRTALFYGLDRKAIGKLANANPAPFFLSTYGQALSDGTMYRQTAGAKALVEKYAPNNGYDAAKAKSLMDACLAKHGVTGPVKLRIHYTETSDSARMATEYIDAQFDIVYGGKIDIEPAAIASSARLQLMRDSQKQAVGTWELCWSSWGLAAEAYTPWKKFQVYTSTKSNRYTNYRNEVVNNLTVECAKEEVRLDEQLTLKYTVEMEEAMYKDMTCIPVYGKTSYMMYAENVDLPMKEYAPGPGFGWVYSSQK